MATTDSTSVAVDVTGVGVNSIDRVLRITSTVQHLLETGKLRVAEQRLSPGGQTATVLCGCTALGLRTRYIGAFGSDEHGRGLRDELDGRGVDVSGTLVRDVANAGATIVVDSEGHRTVLWNRDEGLSLTSDEIPAALLASSRHVHVDDVDAPAALYAVRAARDAGITTTTDIEHASDAAEQLLAAASHPILDHNAPAGLTGERDPERALRKLRRLNAGLLCMTLGEQGAAALDGDRFHLVPAFRVGAVDTTGAGDVFRAGFIYGLLEGWDVLKLLRFANAAAAVSCTRDGAIASVPSLRDVQGLVAGVSS